MENGKEKVFYLDLSGGYDWLIRSNTGDMYFAGKDKKMASDLIERLNKSYNPSLKQSNGRELKINFNEHEIWESPKWETFYFEIREEVLFAKWMLEYALILDNVVYRKLQKHQQPKDLSE